MAGSQKHVELEESSSLLVRTGYSRPGYGIQSDASVSIQSESSSEHVAEKSVVESVKIAVKSPERLWTVVLFALIACVGSLLPGAAIGYGTNTISDVESNAGRYGIDLGDFDEDTFSVSDIYGKCFLIYLSVCIRCHTCNFLLSVYSCIDA